MFPKVPLVLQHHLHRSLLDGAPRVCEGSWGERCRSTCSWLLSLAQRARSSFEGKQVQRGGWANSWFANMCRVEMNSGAVWEGSSSEVSISVCLFPSSSRGGTRGEGGGCLKSSMSTPMPTSSAFWSIWGNLRGSPWAALDCFFETIQSPFWDNFPSLQVLMGVDWMMQVYLIYAKIVHNCNLFI